MNSLIFLIMTLFKKFFVKSRDACTQIAIVCVCECDANLVILFPFPSPFFSGSFGYKKAFSFIYEHRLSFPICFLK